MPTSGRSSSNNDDRTLRKDDENDAMDEKDTAHGALLVSEFPPPPFYYRNVADLVPPKIPTDALVRAAKKAEGMAAMAREEAERNRMQAAMEGSGETSTSVISGVDGRKEDGSDTRMEEEKKREALNQAVLGGSAPDLNTVAAAGIEGDDSFAAVFGEIVEDPVLAHVEDDCEDPSIIQEEMSRYV
mmetsp:Transcript_18793/g.26462  ORF Transcript_18793/g.26462 Transcript_18793/m.26462 type:complete len:186 (+) Transcript_18793:28-585(+)